MFIRKVKDYVFSNSCLYLITSIYMITLLLGNTVYYLTTPEFKIVIKCVRIICYIIFGFNIIKNWRNGESISIGMIVFAVLSCVVAIFSKNKDILFLFVFCYAVIYGFIFNNC